MTKNKNRTEALDSLKLDVYERIENTESEIEDTTRRIARYQDELEELKTNIAVDEQALKDLRVDLRQYKHVESWLVQETRATLENGTAKEPYPTIQKNDEVHVHPSECFDNKKYTTGGGGIDEARMSPSPGGTMQDAAEAFSVKKGKKD